MYEDHTVESKYLQNFSDKEKRRFKAEQRCMQHQLSEYKASIYRLLGEDSPAIWANYIHPNTRLEIKYVLNRIAANDQRDIAFELSNIDYLPATNVLATDMVHSFAKNTACKQVVLSHVGFKEEEMIQVLNGLRHNELNLLALRGNMTEKSLQILDTILTDPATHWQKVQLAEMRINSEQGKSLQKHLNISFDSVTFTNTPFSLKNICLTFGKNQNNR